MILSLIEILKDRRLLPGQKLTSCLILYLEEELALKDKSGGKRETRTIN